MVLTQCPELAATNYPLMPLTSQIKDLEYTAMKAKNLERHYFANEPKNDSTIVLVNIIMKMRHAFTFVIDLLYDAFNSTVYIVTHWIISV
jgi:hypothetical protein